MSECRGCVELVSCLLETGLYNPFETEGNHEKYSYYDQASMGIFGYIFPKYWYKYCMDPKPFREGMLVVEKYFNLPEEIKMEPNPILRSIKQGICPICGNGLTALNVCKQCDESFRKALRRDKIKRLFQ